MVVDVEGRPLDADVADGVLLTLLLLTHSYYSATTVVIYVNYHDYIGQ